MTHEAEGMEVSQLVASSSATVLVNSHLICTTATTALY